MLFKRNDLQKQVLQELSIFLEALPVQVSAWDAKVIKHLSAYPEVFN